MKRRNFIAGLASTTAAWPLAARAQQSAMPVIGYMDTASASTTAHLVEAFRRGLSAAGYDEGRNVAIEYRWSEGDYDKLPALAAELVRRQVTVIATINTPTILAAKAATQTIPIIFGVGVDPIKFGLVASLNHPGGNLTGVTQLNIEMEAKRVQLLHELVPAATSMALLINPTSPAYSEAATEGRFCHPCGEAGRFAPGDRRLILSLPARSNSRAGGAALCARAIPPTRVHGYWWTHELRTEPS
jgi:putative tryptophan/tyrosine transport system substrate-binding protein